MPPACAMAMAMRASVTVSIAEATIGIFRVMSRVMRERISTSDGMTSDRPGCSSTSSKVSASRKAPLVKCGVGFAIAIPSDGFRLLQGSSESRLARADSMDRLARKAFVRRAPASPAQYFRCLRIGRKEGFPGPVRTA